MAVLAARLDVYIYDYFMKRNLQATAKAFQAEGKVSLDPVVKAVANCLNSGFLQRVMLLIHHKQVIPL
uniref:Uncharacterized protein n=1 Tax=Oryza meridionalis TaxID=40149 RepID=A0A0E0C4R3_9ORYZ